MLSAYMKLAPLIPKLIGHSKVVVWATDQEKYILYEDYAGLGLSVQAGTPIAEGGTPQLAMQQNKTLDRIVPKEIYGLPVRSVCIPVEGGTIGLSINIDDTNRVIESIDSLNLIAKQIAATTENISHHSSSINLEVLMVSNLSKQGTERRKELEQVTKILYNVTENLKLLSLNAMIEAARAGEYGKTFKVVANEVKKLADSGKEQLEDIERVIDEVNELLTMIDKKMEVIQALSNEQTMHSEDITQSIHAVSTDIEKLQHLAEKL